MLKCNEPYKYSLRNLLQYSALAVVLAFAGMPLYLQVPDYYATHFRLSLGLLGSILLSLRLVDAIIDPLLGRLSDRFAAQRYGIMLAALVAMVGGLFMLFHSAACGFVAEFYRRYFSRHLGFQPSGHQPFGIGSLMGGSG